MNIKQGGHPSVQLRKASVPEFWLEIVHSASHLCLPLKRKDADHLMEAHQNFCVILDLEKTYEAVFDAFLDLERDIAQSSVLHAFCNLDRRDFLECLRRLESKILYFLTAARRLRDYRERRVKEVFGRGHDALTITRSAIKWREENRESFQILEHLRNVMQHSESSLYTITLGMRQREEIEKGDKKTPTRYTANIGIYVDDGVLFGRDKKGAERARAALMAYGKGRDIKPLIRSYMDDIHSIHMQTMRVLAHQEKRAIDYFNLNIRSFGRMSKISTNGICLALCSDDNVVLGCKKIYFGDFLLNDLKDIRRRRRPMFPFARFAVCTDELTERN